MGAKAGVELWSGRRGFIPRRKIVEDVIFIIITTNFIFLTVLNTVIRLKLNNYDCVLIIRKTF
jgi:hypothetical protein